MEYQTDKISVENMLEDGEIGSALTAVFRAFLHDPFSSNKTEIEMLIRRIRIEASHQRDRVVEE